MSGLFATSRLLARETIDPNHRPSAGTPRGFGIYGGSLIDADLGASYQSGRASGKGYDPPAPPTSSELFAAIFLRR